MSHTWLNEWHDTRPEAKTRTVPRTRSNWKSQNRQSFCRRYPTKQSSSYRPQTHSLAQSQSAVTTQSGRCPGKLLFSRNLRLVAKLGGRPPVPQPTHRENPRKISFRSSNRRPPKKMSQPTSTQLLDHAIWTELGSRNDAEAEAFYDALSTLLSRWLLARSDYPEMEALRLFAKVRAYVATPERFL